MKTKRYALIILLFFSLSCNFLSRALQQATPTALPMPATASLPPVSTITPTAAPAISATPEATSLSSGLYIPPACQGLALATIPAATTVAEPTAGLAPNPPLSKQQQLHVFEQLLAAINKVYLYPDYNGVDWPAIVARYRAQITAGLETEAFYSSMNNFMAELKDEHSQFQSPAQRAASDAKLAGHQDYVGIGTMVLPLPKKARITILDVFPDSPAGHAGLAVHDSILAVDGIPIAENGLLYPQRTRGPKCSAAVLSVQSPGQSVRQVLLLRYSIAGSTPIVARLVATSDGSRIGYIFLPSFFDRTIPGQVQKALEDFGPLDGLIIDNRMNGGGSSDVFEPILAHFAQGTLGRFISRTGSSPMTIKADPINNSQSVPLVVLVGPDTASFGEIFSGVLQDSGRAKVIGQTTPGIVERLHGYTFDDGSLAWIAQDRFDPAVSHANWEKKGIQPDIIAFADWDTFTFENDPAILAALKLWGHH